MSCFLFYEGNSDAYFLSRVLERGLYRLCADAPVDVARVVPLARRGGGLVDAVCAAAAKASAGATLFSYHYDGSPLVARETKKYWVPLCAEWHRRELVQPLVPVVPVREMEAWALADPEALAANFSVQSRSTEVFEARLLNRPEQLSDPKRTLSELVQAKVRRRRVEPSETYLRRLAEEVALEALDRLPSFNQWQSETSDALRKLRIIS